MSLTDTQIADLVAALLTVNSYPLERADALMPAFRDRGLLDPARVAAIPQDELVAAIKDAGYQRGGYVPIVAFRLGFLMDAIAEGQLDALVGAAGGGDKAAFVETLNGLHGFGPRTAEAAWMLWTAT